MSSKSERLDIKVSKEHKELIQLAASIAGSKSVSEFVVNTAIKYSNKIIDEHKNVQSIIVNRKNFIKQLTNHE